MRWNRPPKLTAAMVLWSVALLLALLVIVGSTLR
jgi:hypothetical protein